MTSAPRELPLFHFSVKVGPQSQHLYLVSKAPLTLPVSVWDEPDVVTLRQAPWLTAESRGSGDDWQRVPENSTRKQPQKLLMCQIRESIQPNFWGNLFVCVQISFISMCLVDYLIIMHFNFQVTWDIDKIVAMTPAIFSVIIFLQRIFIY